ncbi:RRP15-like protein [Benincasa hispida]|uniref:RRP15-like protein n=1 Tax=Benincasa hispida TaxID=102211 RepID=UPI00190283F1|nr:RRP15-like protein [Benincasa hispida]XP_038888940.1 RRP15-like protein [Benincasa hispida]
MADVGNAVELVRGAKRRKKMGSRNNKRPRMMGGSGNKVKVDRKMKKLFQKRAREYNSEDDDNDEKAPMVENERKVLVCSHAEEVGDEEFSEGEDEGKDVNADVELSEDDENGEIQPGITKFAEGCRAFRAAFRSILKKSISDETLGPILSANKKLIVEKLAEEEAERKVKGLAKKEKQLVGEKGHVKPATYLDSHEKFLIGVATKGVVKLFNAVNKAQHAQKGLNPSRTKDAKAINKRRKEAFFSELGKPTLSATNSNAKLNTSGGAADAEGPAWAPLRDNYMLTNSKLKDWDKMPDNMTTMAEDNGRMLEDSSSDEDD